ncbi:outer membrane beta-barrel protein [Massilia sp. G4R7]|uniref:Outer membrane beta-barrel protein n=1 Tax=Massilia phyllostachyos TaxID=2898585 RepID=A0ABS8Q7N6_9BURK|nr:OmpW family outer membrane protein [Massilia phyllostachyos]MCD2517763.1 outer membrane beta-barrel protein [Massilia phyllostachyos]
MKAICKHVLAAVLAVAGSQALAQEVQDSNWLVRARAVHIDPANESTPLAGVGAGDRIHVSTKTIPEVDVSYFFTPHLAAELILTYPQKHDVTLDGQRIGSFRHLPPTLTAQYHFAPQASVRPYVGAGVNYTRISRVKLLGGAATLEKDSWGLALQAGVDIKLDARWSVNVDVKKVKLRSDVLLGGAKASEVRVDPVLVGVGVGYRF